MTELNLDIEQIEEPLRRSNKTSECDSIIDSFLLENDNFVEVHLEGKGPEELRSRLDQRIRSRYLEDIMFTEIVDGVLFLKK